MWDFQTEEKKKKLDQLVNYVLKNKLLMLRKVELRDKNIPLKIKNIQVIVGKTETGEIHRAIHNHSYIQVHHSPIHKVYICREHAKKIIQKIAETHFGFSEQEASKILVMIYPLITKETIQEYSEKKQEASDFKNDKAPEWTSV